MGTGKSLSRVLAWVKTSGSADQASLNQILALVQQLSEKVDHMAEDLRAAVDALKADYAAIKSALQNFEATASGLVAQIAALKTQLAGVGVTDPTILADLNQLHTDAQGLVADIGAANTADTPA